MNQKLLCWYGVGAVILLYISTTSFIMMKQCGMGLFYLPSSVLETQRNETFTGPTETKVELKRDFSPKLPNESLMEFASRRFKNCPYINQSVPLFLDPRRSEWVYPIAKEHDMVVEMLRCKVPFSFARYGDGEYLLARGLNVSDETQAKKADHWSWQGGRGKLGKELVDSLQHVYTDIIYIQGLPKPNSAHSTILEWYINVTAQSTQYLSHALLWTVSNWRRTYNLFTNIITAKQLEQPVFLVINEDALSRRDLLLQWVQDIIFFPDDGPNWWETEGQRAARYCENIARSYNGVLFLCAVGPMSEAVIYHMSIANPNNQYIDVGSSMEIWTKGSSTRTNLFDLPEEPFWGYRKNPIIGKLDFRPT